MIHLIDAGNRHLYDRELEDLFRARKQIFADGFGWKLPLVNGLDIDQFDDEHTVYTVGFDMRGNVVMGIRFRPTDDMSLVGDLFAHSLPSGVRQIADGRTWEVTRGFCLEFGRKPWNLRRKAACMIAPFEAMLAAGRDRLIGFTDVRMLNFLLNMGWRMNVLDDAVAYGEGAGFAFDIEVSHAAAAELRDQWGLPEGAYVRLERLLPGEDVHAAARRQATARGLEDLTPREDLSRLRRTRVRAEPVAPPPASRRPAPRADRAAA